MTEFQFIENTRFYQRRFENLHFKLIRELSRYLRTNPIHNSCWVHQIEFYSMYITLTSEWISVLKNFNNSLTGEPDKVRLPTDADINPQGSGTINASLCK